MNNATVVFDIAAIFKELYGYTPARVDNMPQSANQVNPFSVKSTSQKAVTVKGSPIYGLSDVLGREVFCPVTIKAGSTNFDFPYMVIGLRNRMILKRTPLVERGGDVIEEIGAGAWELSGKGFLIDPGGQFPDAQLDKLNQLYMYRQPVNIISPLTDIFLAAGDNVVIADLEIPPKPKVIGVRDFAFNVIQDNILDLYKIS